MILKKTKVYSGLQAFFADIYSYIGGGLLVTGIMAYAVMKMIQDRIITSTMPLQIAIVLLVLYSLYISYALYGMSAMQAQIVFWLYVLLQGFIIGFYAYQYNVHIVEAAVITVGIFVLMTILSRLSYDLSNYGNFFKMTSIAILIAALCNMFIFKSGIFMLIIDVALLIFFSVLIIYDHQTLERLYYANTDKEALAVIGALSLYMKIVTMFKIILRLLNERNRK